MARRRSRDQRPPRPLEVVRPLPLRPRLVLFEDRRTYHPQAALRPAGVFSSRSARRLVERKPLVPSRYRDPFPSLRLGFAVPEKVVLCVRRKQRREALFATGGTGKGARSRRKRDNFSDIRC